MWVWSLRCLRVWLALKYRPAPNIAWFQRLNWQGPLMYLALARGHNEDQHRGNHLTVLLRVLPSARVRINGGALRRVFETRDQVEHPNLRVHIEIGT